MLLCVDANCTLRGEACKRLEEIRLAPAGFVKNVRYIAQNYDTMERGIPNKKTDFWLSHSAVQSLLFSKVWMNSVGRLWMFMVFVSVVALKLRAKARVGCLHTLTLRPFAKTHPWQSCTVMRGHDDLVGLCKICLCMSRDTCDHYQPLLFVAWRQSC